MKQNNPEEKKPEYSHNKSLLREIWGFLRVRKKWWLLPIIIMLIIIGILIVLGSSSSLSPFIYALFWRMIHKIYKWYLWFFERENFKKLKAHGKCKQCGYCCKHQLYFFKCRHLTKEGKCSLHEKDKPLSCRLTPLIIDKNVSPDCGYETFRGEKERWDIK